MRFPKTLVLLVVSAGLLDGVAAQAGGQGRGGQGQNQGQNQGGNQNAGNGGNQNAGNNNAGNAGTITLDANAVQTASASVGNVNATAGEAESLTSDENFINFCSGKTLTNGQQLEQGSCNGIPMGDIPSTGNMVSTIITNPASGDNIAANEDITFEAQTQNLAAGTFTNAASTYYNSPQQLDGGGQIIGHMHFTVQQLSSLNPAQPPDPQVFAFFKGVDDDGNGQGLLSATAAGGLPAGTYRVCTMSSAANHQPVVMPVAQRGAQDDCSKFTVTNGGGGGGGGGGNNNAGNNNAAGQQGQGQQAQGQQGGGGGGGQNARGRGRGRGRFAKRQFIS